MYVRVSKPGDIGSINIELEDDTLDIEDLAMLYPNALTLKYEKDGCEFLLKSRVILSVS